MDLETRMDRAFDEVTEAFPFHDYIGERQRHQMRAILGALGRAFGEFQGRRLLDIGCGPLDMTALFQRMGFECAAVDDLADPWHRRGNRAAEIGAFAERMGIRFVHQEVGDHSIPFEPGSFDVACALSVIEHLHESPRGLLNEMGRFVKPDGLVVITMPNAVKLKNRLSVLVGRTNHVPVDAFFHSIGTWRGHVREYTLAETEHICRLGGFEVVESRTFEHLARERLPFPLRELHLLLGTVVPGLRSGLLVVCRRPPSWRPVEADPEAFRRSLGEAGVPAGVR